MPNPREFSDADRGPPDRRADARLEQADLLDAAMRAVPVAMSIIDGDLRYMRVNEATAAMTGIPVEAHPGRSLREVNPQLLPEIEDAIRHVLATGQPVRDLGLTRPTPHVKRGALEIVLHVAPVRDASGAVVAACCTATDITAWKDLQQQFFQAQRLEAVGELAAGIAHDFKNLLTIIANYTELILLDTAPTHPHRGDLEEIRSAALRANTLASRMVGTAGRRALVPTPIDMDVMVQEARPLLVQAAHDKARVAIETSGQAGVVVADLTQLEQVLLNLVINAVDAIPDGGLVTVATRNVPLPTGRITPYTDIAPGNYVELSVADTGTGMDEATLARIFEPFFTTKPKGKGTGLGLATVHTIVRELGGGLDVESALGAGTTFRVLLPRRVDEEGSGPRAARIAAQAAIPRGTETVLVVEDEDSLRIGIARAFARFGYHVLEARHGGEALRLMTEHDGIALVLSDLQMPGMDGYELATRMREMGQHIPVLFMSGSNAADDGTVTMPDMVAGRDRFISKPLEVDTLLRTAREMLGPA